MSIRRIVGTMLIAGMTMGGHAGAQVAKKGAAKASPEVTNVIQKGATQLAQGAKTAKTAHYLRVPNNAVPTDIKQIINLINKKVKKISTDTAYIACKEIGTDTVKIDKFNSIENIERDVATEMNKSIPTVITGEESRLNNPKIKEKVRTPMFNKCYTILNHEIFYKSGDYYVTGKIMGERDAKLAEELGHSW